MAGTSGGALGAGFGDQFRVILTVARQFNRRLVDAHQAELMRAGVRRQWPELSPGEEGL